MGIDAEEAPVTFVRQCLRAYPAPVSGECFFIGQLRLFLTLIFQIASQQVVCRQAAVSFGVRERSALLQQAGGDFGLSVIQGMHQA
ncbi:MAG: hypothetical protein LBL33_05130, partial [Tannerella sp.]|nr:hypothetical protein [Tannerella sp.]